jgi:hypothetical protein
MKTHISTVKKKFPVINVCACLSSVVYTFYNKHHENERQTHHIIRHMRELKNERSKVLMFFMPEMKYISLMWYWKLQYCHHHQHQHLENFICTFLLAHHSKQLLFEAYNMKSYINFSCKSRAIHSQNSRVDLSSIIIVKVRENCAKV